MSEAEHGTPTVSVVMCTYNGAKYLKEQVDTILAQDYPITEIVVQDDASADDTWTMLEAYRAARPDLFRIYRNKERLGFNRNFHTALLRAKSTYVAIADQDDIWFADKIRRQVEAIGRADVCYTDYYRDTAYTRPLRCAVSPPGDMVSLFFHNVIPGHSMLLRRAFLDEEWAWNDGFYYDWWFLVNAHLRGRGVAHVAEPLNWHRPHAGSAIATMNRERGGRRRGASAWRPYVQGWADLRRMRRQPAWQMFYRYIAAHATAERFALVRRMARLMLRQRGLLPLCLLCHAHRAEVYPGCSGLRQRLRAFCRPAIYAYGNTAFNL